MFHTESDRIFKIGRVHKWHRKETIRRRVKTLNGTNKIWLAVGNRMCHVTSYLLCL